ncbi:histidinol-phosphatase [Desulfogranum marinum]|uniref:histidinol-phosphatase n=1 Tax=Desulfogranum marinum TaxID=453220 RepID=UPI0029C641B3|nr:histidinol-phosphatase [Desulfogranum marinum]
MNKCDPIDIGFDGHVHTYLCNHAKGTMEEYVVAAISRGLHTLCFLEHLEVGITYHQRSWLNEEDFAVYFREGTRLKKAYEGQLTILLGVEAGYNPEQQTPFLNLLKAYPWDRIGLSLHFYRIGKKHFNLLSRQPDSLALLIEHDPALIMDAYFDSLLEAILIMERCDVVCHLDACLRHAQERRLSEKNYIQINTILDTMQQKQIALEINTSGFTLRKAPFPEATILNRAMQRGLLLVAGSDAHAPQQVGRHFDQVNDYLQLASKLSM